MKAEGFGAAIERLARRVRLRNPDWLEPLATRPAATWLRMIPHNYGAMWFRDWWAFVMTEQKGRLTSHEMRVWADNHCQRRFHSRDWTKSGLPFVIEKEFYYSGFWFELPRDARRFRDRYRESAFAVGSWEPWFDAVVDGKNQRRSLGAR